MYIYGRINWNSALFFMLISDDFLIVTCNITHQINWNQVYLILGDNTLRITKVKHFTSKKIMIGINQFFNYLCEVTHLQLEAQPWELLRFETSWSLE